MPAELFVVLAAGLVALQMAFVLLRRAFADERSYLLLLGGVLLALVLLHAGGRDETPLAWFFVALAALFTLSPRLVERREAAAALKGDLRLARRWAILRELIVPGRGSSLRRRLIDDHLELREKGSQALMRRLRNELAEATQPHQAEALHEELVAMLLADQRFGEAVEHFTRHLGVDFLSRRCGLLPHLVRAHCELGDLGAAAALVAVVDAGPAGRDPLLAPLLVRARLLLLAYAGIEATSPMLHPEERAQLQRLARARALAGVERTPEIDAILRAEAARTVEGARPRPRPRAPATMTLIALNCACFAAVLLLVPGGIDGLLRNGDVGAPLARAGALIRPAIFAGEWWRAVAAMFLHAGPFHLFSNMYGLFVLGRFVEDLVGSLRLVVIYFLGGLAGSAASTLFGKGLSVGASGAILGLLGAMIVLVLLRRASFAERWRRLLLWNLALVTIVQIGVGFFTQIIDNAAHIGGLLGGAAATLLFAPGLLIGDGRIGRALVRGVAALCVAVSIASLVEVARTPLERSLARLPLMTVTLKGVQLTVPRHFITDEGKLKDPYLGIEVDIDNGKVVSPDEAEPRYAELIRRIRDSARPAP
jgi:membrane associated rhomboid family serine protease